MPASVRRDGGGPFGQSADRVLALAITLLATISRLPLIRADEGWFDEIYTIFYAVQGIGEAIKAALLEQTNPPGFYAFAATWDFVASGDLYWHRLPVVLCGIATPPVVFLAAGRLGLSRWAAGVAGLLAVASPFLWQMSLEVRAYAPLALLSAIALWQAAGLVSRAVAPTGRQLAALAITQVAMVMLHYFAALSVFGIGLAIGLATRLHESAPWRECIRRAAFVGSPAAIALGAWLVAAFGLAEGLDGRNVSWIPDTSALDALAQLPHTLLANFGDVGVTLSRLLLIASIGSAALWTFGPRGATREQRVIGSFLLLAGLLPVALAWAMHVTSAHGLWVARYLTGCLPGLALLVAALVDAVPAKARRTTALGIGLWWGVAGAYGITTRSPKPDWTTIIRQLAPEGLATLCTDGSFVGLPLIYHARAQGLDDVQVTAALNCTPENGRTWLVYDVERTGYTPAPQVPGLVLGPRVVLFRGLQSLDARRVIRRD